MKNKINYQPARFIRRRRCVEDTLTGLMWTENANINEFPVTFEEAHGFVEELNRKKAYGFHDWRLPARRELFSLISHQTVNPALPLFHPFKHVFDGYYWTSSSCSRMPDQAWYVHMGGGRVVKGMKHRSSLVWPVRTAVKKNLNLLSAASFLFDDENGKHGGSSTTFDTILKNAGKERKEGRRFHVSSETILDTYTGLVWYRNANLSELPVNLETSFSMIREVNGKGADGYHHFHLPTIRELESLVDITTHTPALPAGHPFEMVADGYWSATTSVLESRYAWVLYMIDGAVGVGFKTNSDFYVWPVTNRKHYF